MSILHRWRTERLAVLVERSDADQLYRWAPDPLRNLLRRRFVRQFGRHRQDVLDAVARRSGTIATESAAATVELQRASRTAGDRLAA